MNVVTSPLNPLAVPDSRSYYSELTAIFGCNFDSYEESLEQRKMVAGGGPGEYGMQLLEPDLTVGE